MFLGRISGTVTGSGQFMGSTFDTMLSLELGKERNREREMGRNSLIMIDVALVPC